jgi:ligand-binding SRPBCC domain-containing protein
MRHNYSTSSWVPWPSGLVFAFFANPQNLPLLSPPPRKTRIEEMKIVPPPPLPPAADAMRGFHSIAAGIGSTITVSFRPFRFAPIRMPWEARIVEFAWNKHFCDEQVRGPFKSWQHFHRVREQTQNGVHGTLVTDQVEYEIPFGSAGEIARKVFIGRQLEQMFAWRQKRLSEILARTGNVFKSR